MVDVVAVVTAEHAVAGKRGVSRLVGVCVLRAGVIPEDHTPGSLDVPGAVRALDNTAFTAEELEAIDKASGYSKE